MKGSLKKASNVKQIAYWLREYKFLLKWSEGLLFRKILKYREKHPEFYPFIRNLIRTGEHGKLYGWFWSKQGKKLYEKKLKGA